MPLLDHFRPPLGDEAGWNSFHSNWATRIADQIADSLPEDFQVEEYAKASGGVEIDIATTRTGSAGNGVAADRWHSPWQPPPPTGHMPTLFPDKFEVLVFQFSGGRHLVGAIELVSPGNKDRQEARDAFATKIASYLQQGVNVIVIDVVTSRRANMHHEVMRLLNVSEELARTAETAQYAVSYRPVLREGRPEVDWWFKGFGVGDLLPTMPLRLIGDYFIPVDFEAAYTEALRRRRLI
ncbi:MAG: hypothetical protein JWO38_6075 [Gemmataceae bacterium]|nr:hypothetical protein [Gemmataceae bacterium]